MLISFAKKFSKQRDKAPAKVIEALNKRLKLFLTDSFHPLLNNHQLTGKFRGYRSINITGDWRAIYKTIQIDNQELIIFELLGRHSQLYK